MDKFSIILPVRNGGSLVKECIQSILSQSYPAFNLLVLDNNSSDGTLQWLQTLDDRRIIIIPSNTSLSIEQNWARIRNIRKNEFMTMIGHDDLLHPKYLDELNALIQVHPQASLYQAHYSFIDVDGNFFNSLLADGRNSIWS